VSNVPISNTGIRCPPLWAFPSEASSRKGRLVLGHSRTTLPLPSSRSRFTCYVSGIPPQTENNDVPPPYTITTDTLPYPADGCLFGDAGLVPGPAGRPCLEPVSPSTIRCRRGGSASSRGHDRNTSVAIALATGRSRSRACVDRRRVADRPSPIFITLRYTTEIVFLQWYCFLCLLFD